MKFYEIRNRAIVSLFDIIGKIASRQFFVCSMVGDTFTTDTFSGTRISAVAVFLIFLLIFAAHEFSI